MSCPRIWLHWHTAKAPSCKLEEKREQDLPPRSASGRLHGTDQPSIQRRSNFPARHFLQVERCAASLRRRLRDEARHREHARPLASKQCREGSRLLKHAGNSPSGGFSPKLARTTLLASSLAGRRTVSASENKAHSRSRGRRKASVGSGFLPTRNSTRNGVTGLARSSLSRRVAFFLPRGADQRCAFSDRRGAALQRASSIAERVNKQSVVTPAPEEHCCPRSGWVDGGARSLLRVRSHQGISTHSFRPEKMR